MSQPTRSCTANICCYESGETQQLLSRGIIDSFVAWERFQSITFRNDSIGYLAYLNGSQAVLALTDSFVISYYRNDTGWRICDSSRFKDYPTTIISADMNTDYNLDVVITGFPQANGNAQSHVLLCDTDGTLRYRPEITDWNLSYDRQANRMYSYFSGSNTGNGKSIRYWKDDSLRLIEGIDWASSSDSPPVIERYIKQGNHRIVTKTIIDYKGTYWDTALFRTRY